MCQAFPQKRAWRFVGRGRFAGFLDMHSVCNLGTTGEVKKPSFKSYNYWYYRTVDPTSPKT